MARKIVSAAGDHGIPPEDVVIDPLAMPVGAEPRAVTLFLETVRLIRDELGVNMTCGASNTSFGLPGRHTLGATFLAVAQSHGLTSAIMDARAPQCVEAVRATDFLLGADEWGGRWIAAHRAKQAAAAVASCRMSRRRRDRAEAGTGRVRLTFRPDGGEVRVPAGTTVFDGASWNGIAIDSTCGGHGTCKKCKVRITSGEVPIDTLDPRAFSPDELRDGWRLACRAIAQHDLEVDVPPLQTRPKAALVGVGRHVILRPAVQKRYLELEEPSLEDQPSDLERVLAAVDDFELRVELGAVRNLGRTLRAPNYKVTAVICDDLLIDVEPGDTSDSPPRDRLRPRHHHRGRHPARPGHRPAAGGALDAEPPAAVRRRRDLARVGHDDGSRRAGGAAAARPRDHERAGRGGAARRPGCRRPRSTRSSSAATSP